MNKQYNFNFKNSWHWQAQRLEKQLAATVKRKGDIMDQVTKAYTER